MNVDVLLLGAGPASAATALALAPFCKVVLLEKRPQDPAARVSESLVSAAGRVLDDLGVLESFRAERHQPWHRSVSVWGSAEPAQSDFLQDPNGSGWHIDRNRFDAWIRGLAVERGAHLLRPVEVLDIQRRGQWHVAARTLTGHVDLTAKVVVDGTGRRRSVSRLLRGARKSHDRLLARFIHGKDGMASARGLTFVEAVADGWWYTAPHGNDGRVIVFHTDADLSVPGRGPESPSFMQLIDETSWLSRLLREAEFSPERGVHFTSAHTSTSSKPYGPGWLAVGDAALACDPISSQGVFNALFTGLLASEAIREHLAGAQTAFEHYGSAVQRITDAYLFNRSQVYGTERRWQDRPFWRRRARTLVQ